MRIMTEGLRFPEGPVAYPDGSGRVVRQEALPDRYVTNICFGGPDMRTAFITLSGVGHLAVMDWPEPGLRLNFQP
jgi:gluconolactonase